MSASSNGSSAAGDTSERNFLIGFAIIVIGVISFGLGHIQGKGAVGVAAGGTYIPPGEFDEHYAFVPGGTKGAVDVLALPSGRRLKTVWLGHGADIVRTIASDDAKHLFALDRASGRVSRVDLSTFTVAARSEPVAVAGAGDMAFIHHFGGGKQSLLAVTGEFGGTAGSHVALVDAATLKTEKLIRVPGNAARCAHVARDGRHYLLVTSYNSEQAEKTWADQPLPRPAGTRSSADDLVFAIDLTAAMTVKADVVDLDPKDEAAAEAAAKLFVAIPVASGATGVTVSPDGNTALVDCRWTSTVAVLDLQRLGGKMESGRELLAVEAQVGMGPVSSVISADGNAYTVCFERNELVQWNPAAAMAGDGNFVRTRTPVRYHPTAISAAVDAASGEVVMLLVQGASSLDQYLPVGGTTPANLQMFGVSHGTPTYVDQLPLDAPARGLVAVPYAKVAPYVTALGTAEVPAELTSKRDGDKLHVDVVLSRGQIEPARIEARPGDEVTLTVYNADRVPGMRQGLVVSGHGAMVDVLPGGMARVTFKAGAAGTYWYYITRPTSLGAAETRGRLVVGAASAKKGE